MTTINESTYDDFKRKAYLSSGKTIHNFHTSDNCLGEVCPVHKPSDHRYRDLPLDFDMDLFSFVRLTENPVMENFNFVIDPDDYTYRKTGRVILTNAVTCDNCNERIESRHGHHFVTCSCEAVSVDGGHSYLRRVASGGYVDNSIIFEDINKAILKLENLDKDKSRSVIRSLDDEKFKPLIDSRIDRPKKK